MKLLKCLTEQRKPDGTVLFKEKMMYPVIEEFQYNYSALAVNGEIYRVIKGSSGFEVVEKGE
jgi:hypothetical protein